MYQGPTRRARLSAFAVTLWLTVLLVSPSAAADNRIPDRPRYVFQTIGQTEGYNNISVTSMIQARDGFLWIATQSGLFRYDGYEVLLFDEERGIPTNYMHQVIEAPDGTIWVTGLGNFYYYDGLNFKQFNIDSKGVDSAVYSNFIRRMAFDRSNHLYIATHDGLLRYDVSTGKESRRWTTADGLPSTHLSAVRSAPDGTILFSVSDHLFRLDPDTDEIEKYPPLGAEPKQPIFDIELGERGKIWVRTTSHLMWYDEESGNWVHEDEGLAEDYFGAGITIDSAGELWVPTSKGLFFKSNGKWSCVSTDNGLFSNEAGPVLEDHEGALWVSTFGYGLSRWTGRRVWRAWTINEGLASSSTWSITRDESDRLWVGTSDGINIWDPETASWTTLTTHDGLIANAARRLSVDADGYIWAMSRDIGFSRINPKDLSIQKIPVPKELSRGPSDMSMGPTGKLWVTGGDHLYTLHMKDEKPVFDRVSMPDELRGCTWAVAVSQGGVAYTGGSIGVCRYDGKSWQHFTVEDGLKGNGIEELIAESDNEIWVAYSASSMGITHLACDPEKGKTETRHVGVEQGVIEGVLFLMDWGPNGQIWLGGTIGISTVYPDGSVESADIHDGLIWNDINRGALFSESDGSVWIGTSGGLAYYVPPENRREEDLPRVRIISAELNDKQRLGDAAPQVDFEGNSFIVRFAGLTFRNPHKVLFRYRLVGLDKDFTETKFRHVRYPALPPGKYTFEVTCRSARGAWSQKPATFTFKISTPWWRHWLFITICSVLVVVLVVSIVRTVLWRQRVRDREISALAWESTRKNLNARVIAIKEISEEIANMSKSMNARSNEISNSATDLESAVTEAGAAIEELEATGKQNEENAGSIVESATKTAQIASDGDHSIEQLMDAIDEIENGAEQIDRKNEGLLEELAAVDTILEVINSIADQSQVLSINASIEAALAQKYGAGFGVVAVEMGELAQSIKTQNAGVSELLIRSRSGTKEISSVASRTKSSTKEGVHSANRSREVLKDLKHALDENSALANMIKGSIEQQLIGLHLIAKEVRKVERAASKNSVTSSNVRNDSSKLNEFVEKLKEMIDDFQTPDLDI